VMECDLANANRGVTFRACFQIALQSGQRFASHEWSLGLLRSSDYSRRCGSAGTRSFRTIISLYDTSLKR
jgi:hypothetical protein